MRHDLLAVADLIEVCFASTLDDDGREYLRQMRLAARDMTYLRWIQGATERIAAPLYGFVWEEYGRIVGNLSLIPIIRAAGITYLIANVAVHPEYRQRGIGGMLTQAALEHLRERGVHTAWLQVRDDNPVAYHMYRSLGFIERSRRASWQSPSGWQASGRLVRSLPEGVIVDRTRPQEWEQQSQWLREIYPPEISWNLPLNISRFSPQPLHRLLRWLRGEPQENWAARRGGHVLGFLSWEPARASADNLWLAATPENEDAAIRALLPHACAALAGRQRPLVVNYPAGRAAEAFRAAGFANHQTLVWMSVELGER